MKPFELLGVSPRPWQFLYRDVFDAEAQKIAALLIWKQDEERGQTHPIGANGYLIAEAPNLYRHLYSAAVEYCHQCDKCADGECQAEPGACFVQEWRKTLDRAAGVMKRKRETERT